MSAGTGAIVGSNLVSLYDGMDSDVREDLFDCLLHALEPAESMMRKVAESRSLA